MNKYIGIIFIIVIMFSACSLKTGPDTDTFETTSDLQYNESSDFETAVMNKKPNLIKPMRLLAYMAFLGERILIIIQTEQMIVL